MRKLQISAKRLAVKQRAGAPRWVAWTRAMIARLGLQPRQGRPIDMLWRKAAHPEPGRAPVYPRSFARFAPVLNLHVNVRPQIVRRQGEHAALRPVTPLALPPHTERTARIDRYKAEHVVERTTERLVLSPRQPAAMPPGAYASRHNEIAHERSGAPESRPHANVAHAFDRLLVRRERVTEEQTVERLLRRTHRVEETAAAFPALALPRPAARAQQSPEIQTAAPAARHQAADVVQAPQAKALQNQWAATLDPNRLANQVLREMDRRLIARKERFGRI